MQEKFVPSVRTSICLIFVLARWHITLFKAILGVRLDDILQNLNFLIDVDQTIGRDGKGTHGPDAVLSMVDWTLQNHVNQTPVLSIQSVICITANYLQ
jgi:hypothetical protein